MLVIKMNKGQKVRLFDREGGVELGEISRITPQPKHQHEVLLGFDFPSNIQILRDSLLNGKESKSNGKQQ